MACLFRMVYCAIAASWRLPSMMDANRLTDHQDSIRSINEMAEDDICCESSRRSTWQRSCSISGVMVATGSDPGPTNKASWSWSNILSRFQSQPLQVVERGWGIQLKIISIGNLVGDKFRIDSEVDTEGQWRRRTVVGVRATPKGPRALGAPKGPLKIFANVLM